MGIYNFIESLNNKTLFRNILILLFFVWFFMKIKVGLNIIFALLLGIICIFYLYEKETTTNELEKEQYKMKLDSLNPSPVNITNDKDLVNFIFSVQDFYVFNPQTFEEMVDDLDAFKNAYDSIFNEAKFSHYYYQIADSKKNNALNAFHALIYSIPNEKIYTEKFDRAHKRLETLLNIYMNEIYDQCDFYIYKNGKDVLKRQIVKGPKEYNHYFDKEFTYQFY